MHFHDSGTDTDPNFRGTGKTVDVAFEIRGTEFLEPNQDVDYRNTPVGEVVFTNPANGASLVNLFAGPFSVKIISGDPEGLHVEEQTNRGLPELLKLPHRGVFLRDAGYIVFHNTFDGDEFLGSEIVIDRGPHPEAEGDFVAFCEITTDALGL